MVIGGMYWLWLTLWALQASLWAPCSSWPLCLSVVIIGYWGYWDRYSHRGHHVVVVIMATTGTRAPWSSWPCAVRVLCLLWAQWAPCGHYDHRVLFWSLLAPWALVTIGTVAIVGTVAITGTLEIVVIVDTPSIVMMNHGLFVHCKHHATMVIVSLGGGGLWSFRAPNDHCFHYYHNNLTITMSRQPTMTMVMRVRITTTVAAVTRVPTMIVVLW